MTITRDAAAAGEVQRFKSGCHSMARVRRTRNHPTSSPSDSSMAVSLADDTRLTRHAHSGRVASNAEKALEQHDR